MSAICWRENKRKSVIMRNAKKEARHFIKVKRIHLLKELICGSYIIVRIIDTLWVIPILISKMYISVRERV